MKIQRFSALLVSFMLMLVFLTSCNSLKNANADLQEKEKELRARVDSLYSEIIETFPADYSANISDSYYIVSGTDLAAVNIESRKQYNELVAQLEASASAIELDMLRNLALSVTKAQAEFALELFADDTSAVEQAVSSVESEINAAADAAALFDCVIKIEQKLFGFEQLEFTAENTELMRALPTLYLDRDGNVWLRYYTNFVLPGFEDSKRGFSLHLLLENGKALAVDADSLDNYEHIVIDGAYSVRFNLTELIPNMSPEAFCNGRNRILFTVFNIDNSASFTSNTYRQQYSGVKEYNSSEDCLLLACLISEYV